MVLCLSGSVLHFAFWYADHSPNAIPLQYWGFQVMNMSLEFQILVLYSEPWGHMDFLLPPVLNTSCIAGQGDHAETVTVGQQSGSN